MAAMDFPNSPSVGELFGSLGIIWRWNGSLWEATSGPSGPRGLVGFAKVTANQTGITTVVDLTGLSVSFTAIPGRTYKYTYYGTMFSPVADDVIQVTICDNANAPLQYIEVSQNVGNQGRAVTGTMIETGLSGTVVRKVRCARPVGTGSITLNAVAAAPAFFLVEDVTMESGNAGTSGPWPLGVVSYKQVTTPQTGITSVVDVTGLTTGAITVPVGRRYKITANMFVSSSVANDIATITLMEDAVQIHQSNVVVPSGSNAVLITAIAVITPTAGSHTYKVRIQRNVGTGNVATSASATIPPFLLVEDVGAV